jgi:predicted ATP-dependent serine protease
MIDLSAVPTNVLKYEIKLRTGPNWVCQSCGYYADGSGQWACPGCGKWHYFTGSMKWPVDNEQSRDWKNRTMKIYKIAEESKC